jgi:HlyD family secretion protein
MTLVSSLTALRHLRPSLSDGSAIETVASAPARQSDYLEDILTEKPSELLAGGHYMIIAMFVGLILAASLTKVDIIVPASGRLAADTPPIVVQPLALSVIREIRVKVGDIVNKGDVLATLDPTFTEADSGALTTQRDAVQAEIRRLEAELNNVPYTIVDEMPEEVLQYSLYQRRQSQYAARLDGFDEDARHYQSDIKTTEQDRTSLQRQLEVVRQIERCATICTDCTLDRN